jgi:excisionase family DNA binding protein
MTISTETSDLLYGATAIANWLGLTERQVRDRINKGEIPSFRIGGTICARRSTLATWLAERETAAKERGRSTVIG